MKNVLMLLCATLISTQAFAAGVINGDLETQNNTVTRTAGSDAQAIPSTAPCNCTGDRETTTVADNLTPTIHPNGPAANSNVHDAKGTSSAQ